MIADGASVFERMVGTRTVSEIHSSLIVRGHLLSHATNQISFHSIEIYGSLASRSSSQDEMHNCCFKTLPIMN